MIKNMAEMLDYDPELDVLTFDGVRFSGDFLRCFVGGGKPGEVFRIIQKYDSTLNPSDCMVLVSVKTYQVDEYAFEAWYERYSRMHQSK